MIDPPTASGSAAVAQPAALTDAAGQAFAGITDATRETVTLLLGKLRREGMIELDRRRVVIRDRKALERRAGEVPRMPTLGGQAG